MFSDLFYQTTPFGKLLNLTLKKLCHASGAEVTATDFNGMMEEGLGFLKHPLIDISLVKLLQDARKSL